MSALAVVNPRSGGGRTRRDWKAIEAGLRQIYPVLTVTPTRKRGDATEITRTALREGFGEIIAVGGDGTINETVNGFFDASGEPIAPEAVFAFVTNGTGGDFRKSFGIAPGADAGIARLKEGKIRAVDLGRVSCLSRRGEPVIRHFINIGSFGLSGAVVDSVNRARLAKLFGGSFAFAFHSLLDMLTYRNRTVRVRIDGAFDEIVTISTVAVANGQYFGGGMMVAPNAKVDDGLFDVILMGGTSRGRSMADMKQIYTGEHLNNPSVTALRGAKLVAVPVAETGGRPVLIEVDGESAGRLPATFEILPRAFNLRC
ncbi:MAG TPA: diacylglycerol kinase family protein [Rhizomicrobium sp.]|jgi:YegS/Rv2252/BmrU family lipid kinase